MRPMGGGVLCVWQRARRAGKAGLAGLSSELRIAPFVQAVSLDSARRWRTKAVSEAAMISHLTEGWLG